MPNTTHSKNYFLKLPTGDAMDMRLIGSCCHYADHGLMLLNTEGGKLLWLPETDNAKAIAMRDEIVSALIS
ncbi:hypothetical protein BZG73_15845 [Salinivibrio siamensis]|uniref:Uncharacterized protein n=1 Tax=Salinivibrio siamensis TaxID=414286 RepID=A0ABX3K4R6_9GAMM|nr:hypothetical protein BZG73_15845 [Salinivibrio siamensis]